MLRHSWKMIRLSLVNWYTYPYHDFDISPEGVTTFVAKNGQGKSTAFDAMIQNMTGAVSGHTGINLNAKTAYGNVNGRTISSYALGALNEASDVYLRDRSDTWIAISWQHSRTRLTQTSLIYISAVKGNTNAKITHMMIAGHEVRAKDFMKTDDNGDLFSMNMEEWRKAYPYIDDVKKFASAKEYKESFLRNLWPAGETRNGSFFQNLKMTVENRWDVRYVDRSIREAIISKPNIDIDYLKKILTSFQQSRHDLEKLRKQVEIFGGLHKSMRSYMEATKDGENADQAIKYANVMKIRYSIEDLCLNRDKHTARLAASEKEQERISGEIDICERNIKTLGLQKADLESGAVSGINGEINAIDKEINTLIEEKLKVESQISAIDNEIKAIDSYIQWKIEGEIENLKKEISGYEKERGNIYIRVSSTQKKINEIMKFHDRPEIGWKSNMDIAGIMALDDVLRELCAKIRDDISSYGIDLRSKDAVIASLDDDIKKAKSGIFSIESIAGDFVRAKKKLAEAGIKATFLYEHVTGFVAPEWVPVIESYLGRKRFDLIVSPDDYMEADRIIKEMNNRKQRNAPYISLPDTKIAYEKYNVKPGSAFEKIRVDDNKVAVKSFQKYLGNVICVRDIRESHDRNIGAALTEAFVDGSGCMRFRSKGGYIPSADNRVLDESDLVFMKGDDNESCRRNIDALEKKKSGLLQERNTLSMKKSTYDCFDRDNINPVMQFITDELEAATEIRISEIDAGIREHQSEIERLLGDRKEKQAEITIKKQEKATLAEGHQSRDEAKLVLDGQRVDLEKKKQELLSSSDIASITGRIRQNETEKSVLERQREQNSRGIGGTIATIESISSKIEEQGKILRSRSEADKIDPDAPVPEQFSDMPRTVSGIQSFIKKKEADSKKSLEAKHSAILAIAEGFTASRAYVSEPGVLCESLIGDTASEFINAENIEHNLNGVMGIVTRYEQNDLRNAILNTEVYEKEHEKWIVETFVNEADQFIRSFKRQIRNLNEILRNIPYHGKRYEFVYKEISEYSDLLSDIVKCKHENGNRQENAIDLFNKQNAEYPHLQKISDEIIACEDIASMRNRINPANWYVFDIKIHDEKQGARVPVRFLSQSGTTDSGGEGQAPKYASYIAAAYSTCYPDATKDGGVGIIAIDEAFEGLDNPTIKSIFDMFSKSGIQAIICEPDTKKSIKTLSHICHRITKSDDHVSQGAMIKTTERSRREFIDNCPEFQKKAPRQEVLAGL